MEFESAARLLFPNDALDPVNECFDLLIFNFVLGRAF
jgi:hypothetical protein